MSELVKVYLEDGSSSELIALFASDEVYGDTTDSLSRWANEGGCFITESVVEDGLIHLGFASTPCGRTFNQVLLDGNLIKDFVLSHSDDAEGFDFKKAIGLGKNESYRYSFSNGSFVVITATTLF